MMNNLQMRQRAQVLLETMLGSGSQFRDGQWEAIEAVAVRRQRALVVQRTGWGNSHAHIHPMSQPKCLEFRQFILEDTEPYSLLFATLRYKSKFIRAGII
jgi:hypothetical protein